MHETFSLKIKFIVRARSKCTSVFCSHSGEVEWLFIAVAGIPGELGRVYLKIAYLDIGNILGVKTEYPRFNESLPFAWSFVVDTTGIIRDLFKAEINIVKQDVGDLSRFVTSDEYPVFRNSVYVDEPNVGNFSAFAGGSTLRKSPSRILMIATCTRIGGDVYGFSLSPPNIGEEFAVEGDI